MSYGDFILDLHPDRLRVSVGGGINEESIRKVLRRASYKRRTMVRERPDVWIAYLIRELFKLSKYVSVTVGGGELSRGYRITIAKTRDNLHLIILDLESQMRLLSGKSERDSEVYNGSFYQFLGNSEPVTSSEGRGGRKLTRRGRLDWLREQYKERHGYYPEQEKSDSPKRYTYSQKRLNERHHLLRRRVRRLKETIESGRKRKKLIKEHGADWHTNKQQITPNKARLLKADEPIPFYGKPGTKRD